VHIALTFDNLGEAADLERGLWPARAPLGDHPSVTEALPWLLDTLDALSLRATFCVEALNCEVYPRAVVEIAGRGHEVAMHGFRWCSPEGARRGHDGALAVVPFAWPLVDAFHRLDSFAARRGAAALGPEATADAILAALGAAAEPTVILHPFLMIGEDERAAARRVLAHIAGLVAAGEAHVAPAGELAAAL
jgi:hypothetical protein